MENVAGASGYCHHLIGLRFYMAHYKMFGLVSLPDDRTCTSTTQRWSIPRERHIQSKEVKSVLVKKPTMGADYKTFIKSNLYSPSTSYGILCKSDFVGLEPLPLAADNVPTKEQRPDVPQVATKYWNVLKGSVLSYQQKLSQEYVINDFLASEFPSLPMENAGEKFEKNVQLCLNHDKLAALEALSLTLNKKL